MWHGIRNHIVSINLERALRDRFLSQANLAKGSAQYLGLLFFGFAGLPCHGPWGVEMEWLHEDSESQIQEEQAEEREERKGVVGSPLAVLRESSQDHSRERKSQKKARAITRKQRQTLTEEDHKVFNSRLSTYSRKLAVASWSFFLL